MRGGAGSGGGVATPRFQAHVVCHRRYRREPAIERARSRPDHSRWGPLKHGPTTAAGTRGGSRARLRARLTGSPSKQEHDDASLKATSLAPLQQAASPAARLRPAAPMRAPLSATSDGNALSASALHFAADPWLRGVSARERAERRGRRFARSASVAAEERGVPERSSDWSDAGSRRDVNAASETRQSDMSRCCSAGNALARSGATTGSSSPPSSLASSSSLSPADVNPSISAPERSRVCTRLKGALGERNPCATTAPCRCSSRSCGHKGWLTGSGPTSHSLRSRTRTRPTRPGTAASARTKLAWSDAEAPRSTVAALPALASAVFRAASVHSSSGTVGIPSSAAAGREVAEAIAPPARPRPSSCWPVGDRLGSLPRVVAQGRQSWSTLAQANDRARVRRHTRTRVGRVLRACLHQPASLLPASLGLPPERASLGFGWLSLFCQRAPPSLPAWSASATPSRHRVSESWTSLSQSSVRRPGALALSPGLGTDAEPCSRRAVPLPAKPTMRLWTPAESKYSAFE